MACKYIYEGITYSSKEEFINKIVNPQFLKGKSLAKIDNITYYEGSEENYDENFLDQGEAMGLSELPSSEEIERRKAKTKLIKGEDISKQNQFLHLLSKDSNWVTFFVKSVIQDSAKKGYEKVLFPSGNTASKVEGHSTLEDFKREKEDRINKLEEEKKTLKPIEDVVSSREMFYNRLKVFNLKKANGYLKDGFAIYSNKVSEMLDKSLLTKDVTNNPSGVGFTYITLSKEQKEEFNISIE